jgi:hypothetical protein
LTHTLSKPDRLTIAPRIAGGYIAFYFRVTSAPDKLAGTTPFKLPGFTLNP